MVDVFVSRPNWIPDSFQVGLEGFLGQLDDRDLKPRTIGGTDYPINAPLDAVSDLMDECNGLVILGIPQIEVKYGYVKGVPIPRDLALPTEWNHIEAALAYAKRLPILVIYHPGIARGVFDKGAISNFLYEVDMSDPAWPLREDIRGALRTWQQSVEAFRSESLDSPNGSEPESGDPPMISDELLNALSLLSSGSNGQSDAPTIAFQIDVTQEHAEYLLGELRRRKYATSRSSRRGIRRYGITHEGRSVLFENGLLG